MTDLIVIVQRCSLISEWLGEGGGGVQKTGHNRWQYFIIIIIFNLFIVVVYTDIVNVDLFL